MRCLPSEIIHLYLRGRRPQALVQDEADWRALSVLAKRTLFWCGGWIHGCRCAGNEMRFAIQMGHASVGAIAHHISGAYSIHLRRRRGWSGSVFNHYIAIPIDADLYLDDLVIWLHRPPESDRAEGARADVCWTGDSAYLSPKSLTWITTERVLTALSPSGAGRSAYIRRKTQPTDPEIMAILTGRAPRESRGASDDVLARHATLRREAPERWNIEEIARFVAEYTHISYEDMRSDSRKRTLSKAKVIVAVLCARNGASVAAVARLFGRSRSTLIERADRYRETQPQLFAHAERALEAYLERETGRHHDQPARLPQTHFDRQCAGPARGTAAHTQARADGVEDGIASFRER
jgi:transposase-like protein